MIMISSALIVTVTFEGQDVRSASSARHLPLFPASDPAHPNSLLSSAAASPRRKDTSLENGATKEEAGRSADGRRS